MGFGVVHLLTNWANARASERGTNDEYLTPTLFLYLWLNHNSNFNRFVRESRGTKKIVRMVITLRVWFKTKKESVISAAMAGVRAQSAKLANDNDLLIPDAIKWHYFTGKKDELIEVDIVDVKKPETINGLTIENVVWSAAQIAVYVINVLRWNSHVKVVLIYDDGTEDVGMFIDEEHVVEDSDYKPILPNIS